MTIAAETASSGRAPGSPVAMTITDLSKTYPGTRALRDVSFSVERGAIHALLGGNGSGKSTLIKILAGVETAEPKGEVAIGDVVMPADGMTPAVARRLGLRFVHQHPPTYESLTVAENLVIEDGFPTRLGLIRWGTLNRRAAEILGKYEIAVDPRRMLKELRPATRTMIAIARALEGNRDGEASVLILDEPTASLPKHEADILLAALRKFAKRGVTIIFISHRIDEVLSIADDVTVLRDGQCIITRSTENLTRTELIELILGRKLSAAFPGAASEVTSEPLLEVRHVAGGPMKDVSFKVHPGEVVGVAGLLGSGRSTLLRALFGSFKIDAGEILLDGHALDGSSAESAMAAGVAFAPEDRARDAAFPNLTVRENLSMTSFRKFWRRWRFDYPAERAAAKGSIDAYHIKTSGLDQLFADLSGGNQQKVVLARWMARGPRLLLLDEPTQGVDVGAGSDVYHSVRDAAEQGLAAVVVSSDFEELANTCDRVLIMRDGVIAQEISSPHITASLLTELVYSNEEGKK